MLSFITQQTELSQSSTHMNLVYIVLKSVEPARYTKYESLGELGKAAGKHASRLEFGFSFSQTPTRSGLRPRQLSRIEIESE